MIINELAQWAAIMFLGVFVVGLTRQLGRFLVPRGEDAALEMGPELNDTLPTELIDGMERARLRDLIEASVSKWAGIIVVDDRCTGCDRLLEGIAEKGTPDDAPLVAFSRSSDEAHRAKISELADIVIVDGDRLKATGLRVTPFVMVIDDRLRVAFKEVAPDLEVVVSHWRERNGAPPVSAMPERIVKRNDVVISQ